MTRRRKTLWLVLLATVMLAGLGYWYATRPKIGPRLVGTWIEESRVKGQPLEWHFYVDGRGETEGWMTYTDANGRHWKKTKWTFTWSVNKGRNGDVLTLHGPSKRLGGILLARELATMLNEAFYPDIQSYKATSGTDETILISTEKLACPPRSLKRSATGIENPWASP